MSWRRFAPAGLIALGFQTLSLGNSTALGLNTTTIAGTAFHISIETQNIRYRGDGTDPALSTGVLLIKDADYWMLGINGVNLNFQRTTGTAKVSIMSYKWPGA